MGRREGITAKALARELGVSLSTCYHLINILLQEGYLEKVAPRKGYRLGPAVPALYERWSRTDLSSTVEPVLGELAARSGRPVYLGLLSGGDLEVADARLPPGAPPVGVGRGLRGAAHALALGKVLAAGDRGAVLERAKDSCLEAFTPRTIVLQHLLEAELERVRARGYATDIEEFAENLCCVAAPILGRDGEVEGAVGISTSARRFPAEARSLTRLVLWASGEASRLVRREDIGA